MSLKLPCCIFSGLWKDWRRNSMNYASVELMALRKELEYYKKAYGDAVALRNEAQIERDESQQDRAALIEALKEIKARGDNCYCDSGYPGSCGCGRSMSDQLDDLLTRLAKKGPKT
jgi:hypothetical protein